MADKGHALARDELVRVLTAYNGITTADGAADGSTLIDSNLIDQNDFVNGKSVLILSGSAGREVQSVRDFDPLTGRVSFPPFSAQITQGTLYRIINIFELEHTRDVTEETDTFEFDETNAAEQTAFVLDITGAVKIGGIWLDMVNVTQNTVIRIKHQIDGANYRTFTTIPWLTTDDDGVLIGPFTAYRNIQVTLQCGGLGGGFVDVPYAVV